MSRLFDALQRSESERSGISFLETETTATEVLESAERESENSIQLSSTTVKIVPTERIVSLSRPESLAAEKFRFLAVRLRQMQQNRGLKKLLITSTVAEEGKSFVAANLATTLARRRNRKILLIEGDLRRPGLARELGLGQLPGLSESLSSDNGLGKNVYFLEDAGLWFLPAGTPPNNPLEVMQSGRLSELMNQFSNWFDWVVVDAPPVLPLADTTVWSRVVDGVLLVAREGKAESGALKRGLEMIDRSKLLGAVLNSCSDVDASKYYQRYGPYLVANDKSSESD